MKGSTTGTLIVSVKAVNHGFLVSVRVFATKGHFYLADQVYVSFRVRFEELIKKILPSVSKQYLLVVKSSLKHIQIGLFRSLNPIF